VSIHFTQLDRNLLTDATILGGVNPSVFRKKARILAVQMTKDFTVDTDRGVMAGLPGDWLVTNHPDDDPGSDLWTISAERMAATYAEVA
jgi:hypothetical protein